MKVHTLIPYFYPSTGGVETRVTEVSKGLIAKGWEVVVHTSAHTPDKKRLPLTDSVDGIKIQRHKPLFHRGFYLTYWRPRIEDGDIIDVQSYDHLSSSTTVIKYRKRFPVFLTTHICIEQPEKWFQRALKSTFDGTFGKKALKSAHKIITMTDVEKDWMVKRGVDPNKILAIPSGVGNRSFDNYDATEVKEKYGLGRYIIFIGRMFEEKDPTHLVKAFSKVQEDFKEVSLVFIGPDQGEIPNVKALAGKEKLQERVICTGKIPEKEKYELLSGCEFFAMPSRYEAEGIVFIEAYAQKKAVIGTKVGGVPYVIKDGETGLLYDYGDIDALAEHIGFLLENPEKTKIMGTKGYMIANNEYRWNSLIDRIEKLYKEAIEKFERNG